MATLHTKPGFYLEPPHKKVEVPGKRVSMRKTREVGTGSAGVAVVLQLSPALVAEAPHHQHHRTLLRGSTAPHPAHGLLCERAECGSEHLLHFPAF